MIALHLAPLPFFALAAVGFALARLAAIRVGNTLVGRAAGWVILSAVLLHAWVLHPAVALALVVLVVAAIRLHPAHRHPEEGLDDDQVPEGAAALVLGAVLPVALWALSRPAMPLLWDEFVWLAKARLAAQGPYALQAAALAHDSRVFPAGYPLLWSELAGWLAHGGPAGASLAAVTAGGTLAVLVAWASFVDAVGPGLARLPSRWTRRGVGTGALIAVAAVISAPLTLVHLRAVYADLPVGLWSAALLIAVWDGNGPLAILLGATLAGVKDEGAAHAIMACIAVLVSALTERPSGLDPRREGRRFEARALAAFLTCLAVVAMIGAHRLVLWRHHVRIDHHQLEGFDPRGTADLLVRLVGHATDPVSQGLIWPAAVVVGVLAWARRPGHSSDLARVSVRALLLQSGALLTALAIGPETVRVFARSGTVFHRFLLQLLPTTWVLLGLVLSRSLGRTERGVSHRSSDVARAGEPE